MSPYPFSKQQKLVIATTTKSVLTELGVDPASPMYQSWPNSMQAIMANVLSGQRLPRTADLGAAVQILARVIIGANLAPSPDEPVWMPWPPRQPTDELH